MSKARKQGSREREKKYLVAKNAKQEEIYVFIGFCSAYYIFYFIFIYSINPYYESLTQPQVFGHIAHKNTYKLIILKIYII